MRIVVHKSVNAMNVIGSQLFDIHSINLDALESLRLSNQDWLHVLGVLPLVE